MKPDKSNRIFDIASRLVLYTDQALFLTGKAGTGKTTFLRHIQAQEGKKTVVVAPTGVAAINAGGVTLHTFFQLPLGAFVPSLTLPDATEQLFHNRQTLLSNLRLSGPKRDLLQELELLVIDEVSMLRADLLDAVDAILRYVRKRMREPFGGVQVLFIGDLFQLPPVVSDKEWKHLSEHYASPFFFDAKVLQEQPLRILELQKIYRQQEQGFIDLLNKVRNNEMDTEDYLFLNARCQPLPPPKERQPAVITLSTHNARADAINQQALSALPAPLVEYLAEIEGEFSEKSYPVDPALQLKPGAQVMIIKNDRGESRRFFNGKLGLVKDLLTDQVEIVFEGEMESLFLEKETWRNIRYSYNRALDRIEEEELGTFKQFPLRLAWAITVHKSQGLSFESALVDVGAAFAPGQVYVALSRLTQLEGLFLRHPIRPGNIQTDARVMAFSQMEKENTFLEPELEKAEQEFMTLALLKAFHFEKMAHLAEDGWLALQRKKSGVKTDQKEWAERFMENTAALLPVAQKTREYLRQQLKLAEVQGYAFLTERVTAASDYFQAACEKLLTALYEHAAPYLKSKKPFKYILALAEFEAGLLKRMASLRQAKALTEGLALQLDHEKLLHILQTETGIPGRITVADNGVLPEEPTGKAKPHKAEKGESAARSFALYRGGMPVEDIAAERGLAFSTIMAHLLQYVGNGELPLEQLVTTEKINMIRQAVAAVPGRELPKIRQLLGDEVDYHEIRAVLLSDAR